MKLRCRFPSCKRRGNPVRLPLTLRWTCVCDVHRGPAFLAEMSELVAHG